MANNKKKNLTPTQQEYQELARKVQPPRPVFGNCLRAFIAGGVICLVGQVVQEMFIHWAGFTEKTAGDPTVAVMILISVILTSLGVYDKIAQWAGAGSAVPVTGFANSMASAAIEHRSEGIVLGVGGQMFKIAGPVIVFGTVAAFIIGIVTWLFQGGGGS
ncbi:stage V sporulation protein AC [Paenibacillus crassostreae]|uniref:Stage V sporulation protein AC n=1 Tax=Paenibacillus crassostreae TaxID=1763538 RepID=A0A167BT42_9BACL|nr:stage V sporulation protein AC [Paenibacillus crassostreae]AOZ92466.1 stage V sporulation protein AC [Paenibacillus crassostreae]OAB72414.1 stage V sporulation protein AC [Paenibacillus crassostreae]